MARPRRRWGLYIVIGLVVGLLIFAAIVYSRFQSQMNVAGFIGSGEVEDVEVPPGFHVQVYAEGLSGPRFMAVGPDGVLYVANREANQIVALPDADQNGEADEIVVVAEDVLRPHSLVYHDDAWYVGIPSGVVRLVDENGDGMLESQTVIDYDFPSIGHNTRTVIFLPDGRMAVSVGSSCNVCDEPDPRRAAIVIYDDAGGSGERVFASGLRNAVGLAIHPESGELWATNNGRDLMGDDLPPETVYIVKDGLDYGWPRCHSGDIIDPDFGFMGACDGVEAPVVEMQAHSAPLGLTFYTGEMFPEEYRGDLFVAFHGSWNRSIPTGYKIVRLPLDGSTPSGPLEDFATGWLKTSLPYEVTGRPVGVTVGADGALYVSDDKGGFIYRISYSGR